MKVQSRLLSHNKYIYPELRVSDVNADSEREVHLLALWDWRMRELEQMQR